MSKITIVTKLSAKKILGKVKKPEEKTVLMQVFGIATGIKTGESNYGPWTALTGQFRAVNLQNGEIFQSGICFLPKMGTDLVTPMLKKEGVDGLEFALNVGIVPADNSVGYEYYVEPVLEAKENDPLEALSKKVSHAALTSPASEKEKVSHAALPSSASEKEKGKK